jgi:hypothetical protein
MMRRGYAIGLLLVAILFQTSCTDADSWPKN